MQLYKETCLKCSQVITQSYSTSFTLGIKTLAKKYHNPIYGIYGFVRYADEIVDTFHGYDKRVLLNDFRTHTYEAIETGLSLNPVLHSFQYVVNTYKIERELIDSFLLSMEMDLDQERYDKEGYEKYIYGSAEVVGLMCLRVFCEGDTASYDNLKASAQSLGRAFQKVNFLRDMKSDFQDRGRVYFPGVDFSQFDNHLKQAIEQDIEKDFDLAYKGIVQLPDGARMGVCLAYVYFRKLLKKIKGLPASKVRHERIRVPDGRKLTLLVQTYFKHQLKFI